MPRHPDVSIVDNHSEWSDGQQQLYERITELEFYKLYLEYNNYSEEDFKKFKKNFKKIRGW